MKSETIRQRLDAAIAKAGEGAEWADMDGAYDAWTGPGLQWKDTGGHVIAEGYLDAGGSLEKGAKRKALEELLARVELGTESAHCGTACDTCHPIEDGAKR